jgi:endonuclease/exonuclease/phosphatase family metal-dependent hydrolase
MSIPVPATARSIRLLSANLWNGGADPMAFAEQLEALRVDIACLQELDARQAAAIARALPHGVLEPGAHRADYAGMGIAARRPIATSRLALPERDARVAELRREEWPELSAPLELINLHVQAPHVFPQWRSLALRRAQLAALWPHFDAAPDRARVVCGDFNATPLWPVYRALAARFRDLALAHACQRGENAARTWGPWAGAPRLLRIDHALGARVVATHVEVVRVRGSDHSALLVDVASEL